MSRSTASSCFPNPSHQLQYNYMCPPLPPGAASAADNNNNNNLVSSAVIESSGPSSQSSSLMFNLSVLKDKLTHVQSLVGILVSSDHHQNQSLQDSSATCATLASMNSIIQEFIVTASSMMLTCQHMVLNMSQPPGTTNTHCTESNFVNNNHRMTQHRGQQGIFSSPGDQTLEWFGGESYDNNCTNNNINNNLKDDDLSVGISETKREISDEINELKNEDDAGRDIIELDAADLLAKYTHYCQICGKGFKRDANLRMHMRAHGDEYKTSAALSNPMKNRGKECSMSSSTKKYSCPQEGCRWNQKHAKFQPLKSMICVKNHYKRSHCPKMYVCKRCNVKQFSVLSDLRTHEKHCGDLKWQCSCGTTFSRKDKLMGHVALFVGHAPAVPAALSSSARFIDQLQEDGASSR